MARQMALNLPLAHEVHDGAMSDRLSYEDIHVSRSTFLNGLADQVHRWFRLTPSFGPELVHEMIERLDVGRGELILDPFAGAGTTLIESKLEGRNAVGFEINPLLHFVNQTSLHWDLDASVVSRELDRISKEFSIASTITFDELAAHDLLVPPIHNPTRWWRPDVIVSLLVLKRSILSTVNPEVREFLRLAFAGVLVPDLTNVTLGKLQLHFINRDKDKIDVLASYLLHARRMHADLIALQQTPQPGEAKCLLQDATNLTSLKLSRSVDAVITSPPYPNRYSYVWNTRPHLYMLDFFSTPKAASDLDKKTIGGTWGTATSELAKNKVDPYNEVVAQVVEPIVEQIRIHDNLMANYVMHYFNRLTRHIVELQPHLSQNNRLAYVVGNSWIKEVYVETDVLLAEIIERLNFGYRVFDVHRFRRRHSGVKLYETIVYARKH